MAARHPDPHNREWFHSPLPVPITILIIILLFNIPFLLVPFTPSAGPTKQKELASAVDPRTSASSPRVALNAPPNRAYFTLDEIPLLLNATVTDADEDLLDVGFFAGTHGNISREHGLVGGARGVLNGSEETCELSALPVRPDGDTVLLLHLDNRSEYGETGTIVHDFSGTGNNGSLLDSVPGNGDGDTPPLFDMKGGRFAGGYTFDGVDDYLLVPHSPGFNTPRLSLSAWIRSDRLVQTTHIVGRENDSVNSSFMKLAYDWNTIILTMGNGSSELHLSHVLPEGIGIWHHVVGTYDGTSLKLYVDGDARAQGIMENGTCEMERPWVVGTNPRWMNWGFFEGAVDEVSVYGRTLSPSDIRAQYRLRQGTYGWNVLASDGVNETSSPTRQFILDAKRFGAQMEHPGHRVVNAGTEAGYTIRVKNAGNVTDSYRIHIENPDEVAEMTLSENRTGELTPGSSVDIILYVRDMTPGSYRSVLRAVPDMNRNFTCEISVTTTVTLDTCSIGTYGVYNGSQGLCNITRMDGNVLLVSVGASEVTFPSQYLPKIWWRGDNQTRDLVREAHRKGFRVYAWLGMPHDYWLAPGRHPDWISLLSNGTPTNHSDDRYFTRIIPPSRVLGSQEYLAQLKGVIGELVDLGFDGIDINDNFQWASDASFDDFSVQKFQTDTGVVVTGTTLQERASYIKTNLEDEWYRWRADQVTELLGLMQQYVRDADSDIPLRPHLMVGGTDYGEWGYDLDGICSAVDMPFAMMGMGHDGISYVLDRLNRAGAKRIAASLYLSAVDDGDHQWLGDNIRWAKESGADEIFLNNYGVSEARDMWDTIKKAVERSNIGHRPEISVGPPRWGSGPVYITSETGLNLSAECNGTIRYRVDHGSWTDLDGNVTIDTAGAHNLEYYSSGYIGWWNATSSLDILVDDSPPTSNITLGHPRIGTLPAMLSHHTEINISAADPGAGVEAIRYRLDGGPWTVYSGNISLTSPGVNVLEYYSSDNLGNEEPVKEIVLFLDDLAPISNISVGAPSHESDRLYITSRTFLNVTSQDEGVGVASIEYRIDTGEWKEYAGNISLNLSGEHIMGYRGVDALGLVENENTLKVFWDDIPPEVSILPGNVSKGRLEIPPNGNITLLATDSGAGVGDIFFKMEGEAAWTRYENPISVGLSSNISYYAEDVLGNRGEQERLELIVGIITDGLPDNGSTNETGGNSGNGTANGTGGDPDNGTTNGTDDPDDDGPDINGTQDDDGDDDGSEPSGENLSLYVIIVFAIFLVLALLSAGEILRMKMKSGPEMKGETVMETELAEMTGKTVDVEEGELPDEVPMDSEHTAEEQEESGHPGQEQPDPEQSESEHTDGDRTETDHPDEE